MASTTHMPAAHDGVAHVPSQDPSIHRELVLVDPPLEGRDVANLQRALQARLKARGLDDSIPIAVHGRFTAGTVLACIDMEYALGLRSDTYMKRDRRRHRVVTEGAQAVIRDPDARDADQLHRAKERADAAGHHAAFFHAMAERIGMELGRGPDAAVAFAEQQIGTRERPPGSNSGPKIDDWCRLAGFDGPVPWCGCFVNACIMAGGCPSGAGFIGSTVMILNRAKRGIGGWSFVREGRRGDLALYDDEPGGDPVVHVEIVRHRVSPTTYSTVGGNTTSGNGSQSDGGMVAQHDDRSTMGGFHIVGFARPPYPGA
ncbi:MAG TPA: hypothetical protein VI318_06360 [Baekduia sp.]